MKLKDVGIIILNELSQLVHRDIFSAYTGCLLLSTFYPQTVNKFSRKINIHKEE